jgi:hypothetical protein
MCGKGFFFLCNSVNARTASAFPVDNYSIGSAVKGLIHKGVFRHFPPAFRTEDVLGTAYNYVLISKDGETSAQLDPL